VFAGRLLHDCTEMKYGNTGVYLLVDGAAVLLAARDAARDARLRAEWEAKVKALVEEWEKLAALHHEWENRARVDCRYDDADAHDKHAGAMLMRIRELRALIVDQPEQEGRET
jgi:hypothetical protein